MKSWFRMARLLLAALAALAMSQPVAANPIVPVTLQFELEGLDLDSGAIVPVEPGTVSGESADPQPDLVLAYNSERAIRAVVSHNQDNGVEIAFLDGVAFNLVDASNLAGLTFTAAPIDLAFEPGDSVVLRTDTGAHYLLGNPIEDATGVTFDTQLLDETTAGLLRPVLEETILARSAPLPSELSTGDLRQIHGLIEQDGYRFQPVSGQPQTFATSNAPHGLRAELDGSGLRLSSAMKNDDWDWRLTLTAYGYTGALRPTEPGELVAQANRLEHRRGDLIEWYLNDSRGLEQGFTLAAPPAGEREGALALKFATSGSLSTILSADGLGVRLENSAGETVLRYAGLLAWDATGRELPAQLVAETGGLLIEVNDAGAIYPVTIDPTVVNEDAKLIAEGAATFDEFGHSVSVSGDTVVAGAPINGTAGFRAGSAYVFVRSGTSWSQQAQLNASDAASGDFFGWSVSISGDTVVVGALLDDNAGGGDAGSAYVFVRSGTTWSEQQKLTAGDAATRDEFGFSVSVSGDTVVVGASLDDHDGGVGAGSAYAFVRSGTVWSEQQKLTASDAAAFDEFGGSVALSGETILVGARLNDHSGLLNPGAAYVFARSGDSWSEQDKLIASDAASQRRLGESVSVSGETGVVGTSFGAGAAYVYVRSGTSWPEQAILTASDAGAFDHFGGSVSVSGDAVVVGAFGNSSPFPQSGSAYVYVRSGTSWEELVKLAASDAAFSDMFGVSVALSEDTAVVGASFDDHMGGTNAGSAYVFHLQFNQSPIALCADVTVPAGPTCTAAASVDDGSFDPDGGAFTLSQGPAGPYGLGDTLVTLTVTDDKGGSASCMATVTVVDMTPPQLTVALDHDILWPPNHHMVDIEATVIASDNCGAPAIVLASLTSNEDDDAPGNDDGETTGDMQSAVDDFHFSLRAERAGSGNGRIYTALYSATDGSGNDASEDGHVGVPHDLAGVIDPLALEVGQSPSGTFISWDVVSGAESYDVIRGELNNVVVTGSAIDLGTVICIEANSTDEDTLGWEDGELPETGQAFFYVLQNYDGNSSTYGTESAGKPRAAGPGDCL